MGRVMLYSCLSPQMPSAPQPQPLCGAPWVSCPPASFPGWENEGRKANLKVSGSGGAWTQDKLPSFPGPQFTEKVGGGVQVISEDAFLSDSLSICRCLSHILVTWPVSPQPGKS